MALVEYLITPQKVATVTLNDPENLNAMGEEMALEYKALAHRLESSEEKPRVIIITGAGRAFSAGGNLSMLDAKRTLSKEENKRRMMNFYHSFLALRKLHVPLIAMINGPAVGAGLCLASSCDLRIARAGAKLGITFVKLGLHPGMGGTYFFPKILGPAIACELLLTGRMIDAEEGQRLGLISRVVPSESLLASTDQIVQELLNAGPETVSALLRTLRGDDSELEASLEREASCQAESYASSEFAEGIQAAIEKRDPKWP